MAAAYGYPQIRDFSTRREVTFQAGRREVRLPNTNALVRNPRWTIGLSKTGYIEEAGRKGVQILGLQEVFNLYESDEDGVLSFEKPGGAKKARISKGDAEVDESLTGANKAMFKVVDEEGKATSSGGDAALSGLLAYAVWFTVQTHGVRP